MRASIESELHDVRARLAEMEAIAHDAAREGTSARATARLLGTHADAVAAADGTGVGHSAELESGDDIEEPRKTSENDPDCEDVARGASLVHADMPWLSLKTRKSLSRVVEQRRAEPHGDDDGYKYGWAADDDAPPDAGALLQHAREAYGRVQGSGRAYDML